MLLKRLKPRTVEHSDDGAVLISVIGVSAVIMIVVSLVASSAVTAATFSSTTRAALQSRAAADAGVDTVWAAMQKGTFYCTLANTISTGRYETVMKYYDAAGDEVPCSGTSTISGAQVRGLVTSTGYAKASGVQQSGDSRRILALFDIDIVDNSVALDKALFNDGGFALTSGVDIIDGTSTNSADLYSNGDVTCHSTNYIQGDAFVQGNFAAGNNCLFAGSIWAGGAVTVNVKLLVNGDVMSAGGTGPTPTGIDLAKTWVGGSVVANGAVTSSGATNSAYCSIAGYSAKVCGSVASIESSASITGGSNVAGNVYAKTAVDLGNTGRNLIVGGNVISNSQGLLATNSSGTGLRVGGYVAVKGSSQVAKDNIGNKIGSCAASTTGLVVCNPASPVIPLTNLPAILNFPTNSRVVAPPRLSLPRIRSDAISLSQWTGWTVENVACANLDTRLATAWTGKLLLNVTGCSAPIAWTNRTITLPGDLAIINPSGWNNSNTQQISSNNATKRTFMMIVPSDAKLADGTTDLVTWTNPYPTDPNYFKPTCAAGNYGDLRADKMFSTNVESFLYTPCDFVFSNQIKDFTGQIYSGTATYPNTATLTFKSIKVPGAVAASTVPGPNVIVTQTSRFDARG